MGTDSELIICNANYLQAVLLPKLVLAHQGGDVQVTLLFKSFLHPLTGLSVERSDPLLIWNSNRGSMKALFC